MALSNIFVHHVYFWLNNPGNGDDRAALLAGLQRLSKVAAIRECHIGQPAATNRGVIDNSYAASWLAIFATAEDQDSYQTDPIHLDFVNTCSALWKKVVVYDSIDV